MCVRYVRTHHITLSRVVKVGELLEQPEQRGKMRVRVSYACVLGMRSCVCVCVCVCVVRYACTHHITVCRVVEV